MVLGKILDAVKQISRNVKNGTINENDINGKSLKIISILKIYTPVDLLIRTSGEVRISNFFLWQIAYAELQFLDVLW